MLALIECGVFLVGVLPILYMAYIAGGADFLAKVIGNPLQEMLLLAFGTPAATLVLALFFKGIERVIKR